MPWNEPGGGKDNDPWGSRGNNDGPPDLDELFGKLKGWVGGGKSGGGGGRKASPFGAGLLLGLGLLVWLASGIYIVDAGTRGVVLRFGAYTETTMPGPHWHIPYPVETVEIVDVENRRFVEVGYRSRGGNKGNSVVVPSESLMLTKDENIVSIQLAVQYQVKDARNYLFNVRDPDLTLKQAAESALREAVGKSKMDFVLTEGRGEVVAQTKTLMQDILDQYKTGLIVADVNLQDAQPPEEVQGAFADAIKAREDEVRQKNEAEAYANDIIPKARGAAARQRQEAQAYKDTVIAKAQGEAARFSDILAEYEKAPEVTRKRLYLDAMESVMENSNKVTMDVEGGNNLLYIPVDKMMGGANKTPSRTRIETRTRNPGSGSSKTRTNSARNTSRIRETR